jgi:hypothetical protein
MTALEDSAVAYAQNDGLYVFPLAPRGKTPLTSHGLEDATTELLTIETWWARWPEANVAIRTGDLIVIDEDRPGALSELAQSAGEEIPETRIARTGKGRHYYFVQPAGQRIRNTAGKLAPGIDTRGDGGYVVAPPSIHPDGGIYAWESTAAPVVLPEWIVAKLATAERKTSTTLLDRSTPYGQRALEAEVHAVATAPEGTRNDRLNEAAFALGQLAASGEVDEHDAQVSLQAAARACGLSEREADQTIASGFGSGLSEPRKAPDNGRATLAAVPKIQEPEPTGRIQIEDWATFNRNSQAELEFLIDELWPTKSFAFIASPPKKGKTWLGLAAAISIATGKTFIATFTIPEPRPVLYLALEGARASLRARIGALARGLNIDPDSNQLDKLDIAYRPRGINLADPSWAAEIANLAAEHEYAVIFVDVLRNAARIKENDQAEFSHLRMLLEPALAHTSIALLHHFTKLSELSKERTPAERMSGSGAMYGALDVGLFITGSDDHARKLRIDFDGRDIAMPDPVSIYLEGDGQGPNKSLTYDDTAFWRGDIDEVAEDNVAVPSVVVIEIVRRLGEVQRKDLIAAIADELPDAEERTIIARIEKLAKAKPPTLVRVRTGVYALRSDEMNAHAQTAHNVRCATEPHNQADTDAHAHDAHDTSMSAQIPLNHAGLRDAHDAHPYGIDAASVRDDDIPF